jgi:hypothetical protein
MGGAASTTRPRSGVLAPRCAPRCSWCLDRAGSPNALRAQRYPIHRDARHVPLRESYLECVSLHRIQVLWEGYRGAGDRLCARKAAEFDSHQTFRDRCCCGNLKLSRRALGGSGSNDPHEGISGERTQRNAAVERTCPEVIAIWKSENSRLKTLRVKHSDRDRIATAGTFDSPQANGEQEDAARRPRWFSVEMSRKRPSALLLLPLPRDVEVDHRGVHVLLANRRGTRVPRLPNADILGAWTSPAAPSRALPARCFLKPAHPPQRFSQVLGARGQKGFENLRLLASPKISANDAKRPADAGAQRFNAFGVAQRLVPIRRPARGSPVRVWQPLL